MFPSAVENLGGKTKIVASRALASPAGTPAFHRLAEIHFLSIEALEACTASEGGKQTLANAVSFSAGSAPVFLIAEEEIFEFERYARKFLREASSIVSPGSRFDKHQRKG